MYRKLCKICKMRIFVLILALASMAEFFLLPINRCDASGQYDIAGILENCFSSFEDENGNVLSGDILLSAGTTDCDWLAFSCGRYEKKDTYDEYLTVLENYVTESYEKNSYGLSRNKATEWHRIALAIIACKGNPEAFGTDAEGNPVNLIADGTYNCKIGKPWKQGINGAAYALITLDSKKYEIPDNAAYTREDLIEYLIGRELPDGGFALGGDAADADVTGIVIQALAPYYDTMPKVKETVDRALERLSLMQLPSGNFESFGESNLESTAQVLTALTSMGIDIMTDERFITNEGKTLLDGIMMYYNSEGSGFSHILGEEINLMATHQAMYALISYERYEKGLGRLYDFTDKGMNAEPVTPPAKTQLPAYETQAPAQQTNSPAYRTESPACEIQLPNGGMNSSPYVTQPPVTTNKSSVSKQPPVSKNPKISKKNPAVSKTKAPADYKNDTTAAKTEIIKSRDITIKRKRAYIKAGELDKVVGTGHNIRIITRTKEGKLYKVTFNGKDITNASDMHFSLSEKSAYEEEIRSLADSPYIMSIETENGITCDAFIELDAGLDDGEYLLMKYDKKEKKPVFIDKIASEGNILRFVIDSGGEYFTARRVKSSAISDSNSIFVPPKAYKNDTPAVRRKHGPVLAITAIAVGALSALILCVYAAKRRKGSLT